MDKEYIVEDNQLKVETTIPARTIPEKTAVTKLSLDQVNFMLKRATDKVAKLQEQLTEAQAEETEWKAAKKAAVDGGLKTREEIKAEAAEVTPTPVDR